MVKAVVVVAVVVVAVAVVVVAVVAVVVVAVVVVVTAVVVVAAAVVCERFRLTALYAPSMTAAPYGLPEPDNAALQLLSSMGRSQSKGKRASSALRAGCRR